MNERRRTSEKIRSFNRFYLPYFHLISQKYLNSDYSVAEARILYEIYANPGISARDIARGLRIDKSYLSRILKRFESRGIVLRTGCVEDSRIILISLTTEGEKLAEHLIQLSNQQIGDTLTGLSVRELKELCVYLDKVIDILDGNGCSGNGPESDGNRHETGEDPVIYPVEK